MTRHDPWGADTVFESTEGDDDQEWCPDDPDYKYARYESDYFDAQVDQIREENKLRGA